MNGTYYIVTGAGSPLFFTSRDEAEKEALRYAGNLAGKKITVTKAECTICYEVQGKMSLDVLTNKIEGI